MSTAYDSLMQIIDGNISAAAKAASIRSFARDLDWTPSYDVRDSFGISVAEDHLVVEHGLDTSAVISFLKSPNRAGELSSDQLKTLLTISYNNLVDWHIFVSEYDVRYVNNRQLNQDRLVPLTRSNHQEALSSREVIGNLSKYSSSNPQPSCDDAFVNVISRWKRLLRAEYPNTADNRSISALFNAIIFARGCEDSQRQIGSESNRAFLTFLNKVGGTTVDMAQAISEVLVAVGIRDSLNSFVDTSKLAVFSQVDVSTARELFRDFYRPANAPYALNFALLSKHALSRIYERYVAILEFDDDNDQLAMFSAVPAEKSPDKTGSVYTPQFIAGFFARFIQDNTTPRAFRSMTTIDPACGSGIFLRTILEHQCNPLTPGVSNQSIEDAFAAIKAVDRDENACEATKLSLTLLYLVAMRKLPSGINIINGNAISLLHQNVIMESSYDAVLANPPYIKLDHLPERERDVYSQYLGAKQGRVDAYLAFVKLCADCVKPGGFVCLVLPQVFLLAKNARILRKLFREKFVIRCIVDLAAVPVFGNVGAYSILLIAQKNDGANSLAQPAQLVKVQEFAGPALQACLDKRTVETPYYSVFEVPQSYFDDDEWIIMGPRDVVLSTTLKRLKPISHYLEVKQGFVTGADNVFVLDRKVVPKSDQALFVDYLPDRRIERYKIPHKLNEVVFYPFLNGKPLSAEEIERDFHWTWSYLVRHEEVLKNRKSVSSGEALWWRPVRPRDPSNLLRPKIVCPHLMLTPRFGLDTKGSLAVSRSPFLLARDQDDNDLLKFFCAVLNSPVCHWYIQRHSPKYSRGYNRVEVNLIKSIPVPNPHEVDDFALRELLSLVNLTLKTGGNAENESKMNQIVAGMFGLSTKDSEALLRPL